MEKEELQNAYSEQEHEASEEERRKSQGLPPAKQFLQVKREVCDDPNMDERFAYHYDDVRDLKIWQLADKIADRLQMQERVCLFRKFIRTPGEVLSQCTSVQTR